MKLPAAMEIERRLGVKQLRASKIVAPSAFLHPGRKEAEPLW